MLCFLPQLYLGFPLSRIRKLANTVSTVGSAMTQTGAPRPGGDFNRVSGSVVK